MKYMLDTNICIYLIKKHPQILLNKFTELAIDDVCISVITKAELDYGVYKSSYVEKNQHALRNFLAPLEIMPLNDEVAERYGFIRTYIEKKGLTIGSLDLFIAAHAVCLDLILVTNNLKEFTRVPNLKTENWIDSLT